MKQPAPEAGPKMPFRRIKDQRFKFKLTMVYGISDLSISLSYQNCQANHHACDIYKMSFCYSNNQIHIKRTFNHGAWYKPKTKTSNRKIDIGPSTMQAMKNWHSECPKTELDLIFPNETGGPIDQSNMLRHHFYRSLKKAGIERLRFHDLRHTYASLLVEQGENIKYIQSQLGHSSPTVTLNVYAHLMKPINHESACKLENAIFETNGSNLVAENKKGMEVIG